jgi:hypothetical protein
VSDQLGGNQTTRCKLGVLLVHGIGDQKEGETLASFGEPLIALMREWIGGHGSKDDGVDVTYASLFPSRRQSPDPAHALIDIRFSPAGEQPQRQQWMFAESWWGEQVRPPGVFDLLGWLFSRGVWVLLAHLAEQAWVFTHPRYDGWHPRLKWLAEKADQTRWRYPAWLWSAALFLPLAALFQCALLVAWVAALVPIPMVRRFIAVVLQHATLILGDSYGLVANETQRGAIITRFQNTVVWLRSRCERLVIVAHSQGTAVVHAAMAGSFIEAPAMLVTFGSGLAKLAQLRRCELVRRPALVAAGWIVPTALFAAFVATMVKVDSVQFVAFFLGLGSAMCALLAGVAWYETRADEHVPAAGAQPGRWVDFYATSDPVPQGDLTEYLHRWQLSSEPIVNRRSILSDHGAYWKNKPEFVMPVVKELDQESGALGLPVLGASGRYVLALRHHRRAIVALSVAWWAMCLSLVTVATWQYSKLAEMGLAFLTRIEDGDLKALAEYVTTAGRIVRWLTSQSWGSVPASYATLGYWGLLIAGMIFLAYLWWQLNVALLTKWDSAQLGDFLRNPTKPFWGPYGALLVWPFVILFSVVPPISFAYAVETGESAWLLPVQAMVSLLLVEVALFQLAAVLGALYTGVMKAWPVARTIARTMWATTARWRARL